MSKSEAVKLADTYRGYGAAIRLVSAAPIADLKLKSRVISYLYEQGHAAWKELIKLECPDFAYAFDSSRAKARR